MFKSVGVGRRIIYFLLASSLISMLLALCDYRSLDRSVVVLNKAHLDVSRLLIWWNALSVAEKNSKANANRLVSVTENAAVAEAQILLGGHAVAVCDVAPHHGIVRSLLHLFDLPIQV